jgi:hypothetical protein
MNIKTANTSTPGKHTENAGKKDCVKNEIKHLHIKKTIKTNLYSLHINKASRWTANTQQQQQTTTKQTLWPESASELYRLSDRRLSVNLVPAFADRGASRCQRSVSPTAVFSDSEFLATDLEVRIRFPALPDFLRNSGPGTGFSQALEYNWGAPA